MSPKFKESLTTKSGCLTFRWIALTLIGPHLDVESDADCDAGDRSPVMNSSNLERQPLGRDSMFHFHSFYSRRFFIALQSFYVFTFNYRPGLFQNDISRYCGQLVRIDVSEVEKFNSHRPCQVVNSLRRPSAVPGQWPGLQSTAGSCK
jgi:hypothetical protein